MTYVEEFIERNEKKPFITNLRKYNLLTMDEKKKVVSSFFTHLVIDSESGIDNQLFQEDVLGILFEMTLYKQDTFLSWLSENITIEK